MHLRGVCEHIRLASLSPSLSPSLSFSYSFPLSLCFSLSEAEERSVHICIYQRCTKAGKLNQRISRIYRHAIPGYRECTVSVTSGRIFLGTRQFSLPAGRPLREKNLSPGYYRSFDLVSSLPRNSLSLSLSLSLSRCLLSFLISVNFKRPYTGVITVPLNCFNRPTPFPNDVARSI